MIYLKSEFRKANSLDRDLKRWQTVIRDDKDKLSEQLKIISDTLHNQEELEKKVEINPAETVDYLNSNTSSLRDTIFRIREVVEETEGASFELESPTKVLSELRVLKDISRSLDEKVVGFIKLLSYKKKGDAIIEEMKNTKNDISKILDTGKSQLNQLDDSLVNLQNELSEIEDSAKNLSAEGIM